tara:strand:+ start:771 stop:3347 length:2577 start_codon:yes stop_codon:yes gene_type:complete
MANTEKIVVQVVVQGDKQLDNLQKKTKSTTIGFGKMAAGVLAAATAFRTVTNAVGNALKSFRDFEFQMAKVKAITGANQTQFNMLTKSAQQLGRTTFFTATEVAKLQTNYGKLGFTTGEILKAQEATLALAVATDSDLARAAIVAGAAVRGFGLDAGETQRVTDVMAVSFTSSAMDIEKFQTSMTKVAPIAAAAGISIEATTAVMSKLTDTGIEASIAGTSLRNIFLKMQDSSSDLSKHLGFTVNSSEDLQKALLKLNKEGLSNEEIMGLVDIRQVAAFNTMIRGAENIGELTQKFNSANGALKEMVAIIEDNLEGDLKKLSSAADGLRQDVGGRLSPTIREGVQDLTDLTNAATDNADAIAEIAVKIKDAVKQAIGFNFIAGGVDNLRKSLNFLTGTEGWREFTDFIGLTTAKNIEDIAEAARLERLNEQLESTLDLQDSNLKLTKKNINTLEFHIRLREQELEVIKEKNKSLPDVIKDPEEERLESELKQLKENLKQRQDILFQFEETAKQTKKESDAAAKRIKDAEDAAASAAEKARKDKEFEDEKQRIDRESRELLNIHKQGLINKEIEDEVYNEAAFDIEQQRLEDLKNLYIKYGEDVSVINGQILENELNKIQTVAEAEKAAFDRKQKEEADEKKDREDKINEMQEIGNQLIYIAGEEKSLQGVKEAGIKISRAAAIAKNFEAMADYGRAISSAAADSPWWMKIINVVGLIAAMASTLSLMKSMKNSFASGGMIEEFANGGMVHGRSHAQGGEKFAVGGRVVELEGGEAVINKRSTAMFRNQLSAMNSAGGGVKFADGGLLNQPSFSQQQFNALGQNQMMGAMGSANKVVVVEADITDSQNSVSVIEADARI